MKYITMKKTFFTLFFVLLSIFSFSQNPPCRFQGLANDLADANHGSELKALLDANPGASDAYFFMFDAFGRTRAFTRDVPTIKKVADLLEDASFTRKLGQNWQQELSIILEKNRILHCAAAGAAVGKTSYFSDMPEFLEELRYFIKNFDISQSGPDKFYRWLKRTKIDNSTMLNEQLPIIDEMYQTLYILKKKGFTNNDIASFGNSFEISNAEGFAKEFDFLTILGRHIELKNVNYVDKPLINHTQTVSQLIDGYFKNIDSFDKFEWILSFKKLKVHGWADEAKALTNIKTQFKEVFLSKQDEIFNVIWDNASLRTSLFGAIPPNQLNVLKNSKKIIFINWIETFDDQLYKFIKVE